MDRLLIVPAAGRGSRLGRDLPKALVPVAGRPMLAHLLDLHRTSNDLVVVVIAPSALDQFEAFASRRQVPLEFAIQERPTGMLDAIIAAAPAVARLRPTRIALTWCDQLAVSPMTVDRLRARAMAPDAPALVFPTVEADRPYIHFDRDSTGRIVGVRHQREGDEMPSRGEGDVGLFDLSLDAYLEHLPAFARDAEPSVSTRERNFLPFIPWLAARCPVETITAVSASEAVGVNTPEELAAIEAYLTR
jgi:bifunctional UDP-N-acetylglucosamine pyrophosphorylase/glucosamine-1-phosphate N-acetyltransferase